eukprot:scaffold11106_cov16-Prasinocladus_malaysianus.AAC.1
MKNSRSPASLIKIDGSQQQQQQQQEDSLGLASPASIILLQSKACARLDKAKQGYKYSGIIQTRGRCR